MKYYSVVFKISALDQILDVGRHQVRGGHCRSRFTAVHVGVYGKVVVGFQTGKGMVAFASKHAKRETIIVIVEFSRGKSYGKKKIKKHFFFPINNGDNNNKNRRWTHVFFMK